MGKGNGAQERTGSPPSRKPEFARIFGRPVGIRVPVSCTVFKLSHHCRALWIGVASADPQIVPSGRWGSAMDEKKCADTERVTRFLYKTDSIAAFKSDSIS